MCRGGDFMPRERSPRPCVAMHKMCSCSPSLLRDGICGARTRRFAKPLTDPFHRERIGLKSVPSGGMDVIEVVASPSMGK